MIVEEIAGSDLSGRARNQLVRNGVLTTADLSAMTIPQIMRLPEIGKQTAHEIIGWMVCRGLGI